MAEVLLYNILTIPTVNALCMCADATDKDDDYWKWLLLQTLAYWARATQFETNAKYNMLDLASAIKTGTAAFGTIESYADVLGCIGDDYYGKSGAYEGYSKFFKSIMKTGPQKNIWEQLNDPVAKRRYQESQIMRMDKEDK